MEKEIRNLGNIQIRAIDGESSRHIEGYALMFDTQSEYIGFYETIERGAVTQEMVDACDVFATFNHDMNKIFARSNMGKGSLTLTVDDTGLKYEFDAPNTALGDELIEYLKRGDIDKSSFAFYMNPDDDEAEFKDFEKEKKPSKNNNKKKKMIGKRDRRGEQEESDEDEQ